MTKIRIPLVAYQTIPAIYKLVDDLTNLNSQATKHAEGDNLIIEFPTNIKDENKFKGDESVILSILAEGGEIEDYLFAIKQPNASSTTDVPEGVPSRLFRLGAVRNFSQWFGGNAEVWVNDTTNEFMYYNLPNPSDAIILKASESELIRQLDTNTFSFHTVAEVKVFEQDPNWVKL